MALAVLGARCSRSRAAEFSFPDLETAVPGYPRHHAISTLRGTSSRTSPKCERLYQGHVVVDIRHIGGPDEASAPPETINLPGIAVLPIRVGRQGPLAHAARSRRCRRQRQRLCRAGALRSVERTSACSTPPTSPMTAAPISAIRQRLSFGDNDAVITMSTHFNSNQGYMTTALILLRDDRLQLIDTIFTFDENLCAFRREQVPSFKVTGVAGARFAAIVATVTETTDAVRAIAATTSKSRRRRQRTITVTYHWDDAASRYAPDSDALKKLAIEEQETILSERSVCLRQRATARIRPAVRAADDRGTDLTDMDKGKIFRALHEARERLRHPQPVGCRHRQAAGLARLQGARHDQRRLCLLARPARRRRRLRGDDPPLPRDGGGDRPAGLGRPREGQGRQPGKRRARRSSPPKRRASPAARSRTTPAIPTTRSTISISPSSASRRRPTPRAR